jgi:formylglycine-generating enzyme required for sulfatase activity
MSHDATGSRSSTAFALIPEGWFLMGSEDGPEDEQPVHRVWVDAFELAISPVTRAEYREFLEATHHDAPRDWHVLPPAPDVPVVGVSWLDCVDYCAWRTAQGQAVRLPTEAEWERAARGNLSGRRFPWGDAIPDWIPEGGRGPLDGPWRVTLGEPNDFGLYGIAANIHEWCFDWYAPDYYAVSPERNPVGPPAGVRRASRGGSWRHAITISRCAARSRIDPSFRYADYGFRVAGSSFSQPVANARAASVASRPAR